MGNNERGLGDGAEPEAPKTDAATVGNPFTPADGKLFSAKTAKRCATNEGELSAKN